MAEYCRDCAISVLGLSEKDIKHMVMSDEDDMDVCEGCGQLRPVLVCIKQPWYKRLTLRKNVSI
jgi:hypothetical protein